ncbi:trypsin-like peptidase domain-containing protein [Streptomyces calidiresistens]|uniref:Trypsin-like serine protease n=1 Tax=Streptomyces calidiresistens TaxID=1485586 RepID=A0A7W3XVW6_9ACTN|nr:trypsin-like peptidase domain-containing protein [Streptomyces calidiresistens]MBB0229176.1 trypsin-like serine protease [Streptomyces calidiresistens]
MNDNVSSGPRRFPWHPAPEPRDERGTGHDFDLSPTGRADGEPPFGGPAPDTISTDPLPHPDTAGGRPAGPRVAPSSGGTGGPGGPAASADGPADGPARRRRVGRPLALLTAVAVAAGAIGGVSGALLGGSTVTASTGGADTALADTISTGTSGVAGIAAAVSPGVVEITTESSTGSGVILTADGEILTNNHVVAGASGVSGGGTVTVTLSDGSTAEADVVGTDPDSDLALLRARDVNDLSPVTLGDSDEVALGDQVIAIGSPGGLSGTVTSGIVSALDREVTVPRQDGTGRDGSGAPRGDWGGPGGSAPDPWGGGSAWTASTTTYRAIQTDAALNPGNSGGALINSAGEVIGINSAMYSTSQDASSAGSVGLGFAIPINDAEQVVDALRADAGS